MFTFTKPYLLVIPYAKSLRINFTHKCIHTSYNLNKIFKQQQPTELFKSEDQNPNKQMAKSRYEYVKLFETNEKLLPNTWIVVRIDGRGFHKFSYKHHFTKPNDEQALNLMNEAAVAVMREFKDIILGYGQSDEYSFVFKKNTVLYNRRGQKITSYVNSLFTSAYVMNWMEYFPSKPLLCPPFFDARYVLYPSDQNLRDYLSWRQADVHVNNLYNTAFWNLLQKGGLTNREAEKKLSGTVAADKNELLFTEFGINYNNEPAMYRKGTILLRKRISEPGSDKIVQVIFPFHIDMIKEQFWNENPELLAGSPPGTYKWIDHMQTLPPLVNQQIKTPEKMESVESEGEEVVS